jgi:PAS domain S-box-containing protein
MTRGAMQLPKETIPGSCWARLGASRLPQWMTGIGCLVLSLPILGWLFEVPVLRGFGDPGYAVAPLSAINGCLITVTAFLAVSGRPWAARIVAIPAAIMLSLIALEYLTGVVAVERWFFFEDVQRLGVRNNGLSPGGTVAVAAIGGIAAVAVTSDRQIHRVVAIILSSASIALTLLATTALAAEPGGTSPGFLGRSAISSAFALLPATGVILYAMRRRPGERGWPLIVRLTPAIVILPAIPSLFGFAAFQMHVLGFSAAQFLVLSGNVLIMAAVLMRVIRHANGQARALAIREAKLSGVLAMVPDAVILIDEAGKIVEFSAAAERLWGYRADEVVGRPITLLGPESHATRYRGELADLQDRELSPWDSDPLSAVGQRGDGSLFPIEVRAGRVQNDDIHCLTIFIRDMSMQFGAEDQVAQLNAELAHLARQSAMGEAAADLAHELNQPLTAAANYLSAAAMLARQSGAEGPGPELVGNAREQVMHAGEIIRRLRSFTERNDTERSVEPLQPMIEDAARLVLVGSSRLAAQVDCDVEPAGLRVFVDRVQVQQVLVNLMRNAVEALRDSAQNDPRIWVSARPGEDAMVEIRCRDNGPGLPPETLAHLFQRFSANRASEGMGIGLSISKRIVELHGGVFSAANADEGGAEFCFTLPTLDGAEAL